MTDTNSPDPLAHLTTLRPDSQFAAEWDHATSTAVLDRIVENPRNAGDVVRIRTRRPRRHQWAAAGLVAAGAAAAAVVSLVLPAGTPGGPDPAAAAELRRLAVVAGQQGGTVQRGQFAFRSTVEEQTAEDLSKPPLDPADTRVGKVDRRPQRDTYRSLSGVTYTRTGSATCLTRSVFADASADDGRYEDLTGRQLADLPADPDRLAKFFDAHPEGDNRGTRNRFMAVGDLLRSGLASPQLRAAGLGVLADSSGLDVRRDVTDDRGRRATAVDQRFDDGVETLFFDPTTSILLEEYQTFGTDGHYSGIVLASRVVDRLPDLPRCKAD